MPFTLLAPCVPLSSPPLQDAEMNVKPPCSVSTMSTEAVLSPPRVMSKFSWPAPSVWPLDGVELPLVTFALNVQPEPSLWSPVVPVLPSTSMTLWTVMVPPQRSSARAERSAASVLKSEVMVASALEMSSRFETSRSLPMPSAMMREPAAFAALASGIAAASIVGSSLTSMSTGPKAS